MVSLTVASGAELSLVNRPCQVCDSGSRWTTVKRRNMTAAHQQPGVVDTWPARVLARDWCHMQDAAMCRRFTKKTRNAHWGRQRLQGRRTCEMQKWLKLLGVWALAWAC